MNIFKVRLEKLLIKIKRLEVDGFYITNMTNIRYLTGFTGSAASLLIINQSAHFFSDGRYTVQAKEQVKNCHINITQQSHLLSIKDKKLFPLKKINIAFEADHLSFSLYSQMEDMYSSINWVGTHNLIEEIASVKDQEEAKLFHKKIKIMCNKHDTNYYLKYKKWCDDYFYLPHRKEKRGIGGIFFDYKIDNWKKNFSFVRDAGLCFLDCAKVIIRKKMYRNWTKKQKDEQLIKRGRYVEFNLLYDRGTTFGLKTGGNAEAILMSLPPTARWK